MKTSHIYWFAPFNLLCPSTKYRGRYPIDYFENSLNITCDFIYPDKSIQGVLKFIYVYFSILFFRKQGSLIVIQKICTNRFYANALKFLIFLRPTKSLYDIDDAEYLRYPKSTLEYFLKKCQHVSVGSTELYNYALTFNPNVFIQTSPIIDHVQKKRKRNSIPNIGWVGDLGNGNMLSKAFCHKTSMFEILFPELKKIKQEIKLTLIGVKNEKDIPEIINYFKAYPNINICIPTNLDWKNDLWIYSMIKEFDIGVSPMINHPFNKSKSAFKAKQYLSCGVPTIACDVGDNSIYVKHKINGLIIDNTNNYLDAINYFISMDDDTYFDYRNKAIDSKNEYTISNYCNNILTLIID